MYRLTEQFELYCKQELDFENQISSVSYGSLSLCIIDCVFSLRAQYYKSTEPVVRRYASTYLDNDLLRTDDNVSKLISHIQEAGGPDLFAENVLRNRQRSGGVLKAEICLQLATYLQCLHIETIQDFQSFEFPELLEVVIHSVKGIGNAGTNYLFMLAGDPNRCKPDTHIHHCIRDACGTDVSDEECQVLFTETVARLKEKQPNLTVAKLDGIIWRKYAMSDG